MLTPKPDIKMIKKVKVYRKKKLSYGEIGRILNRDKSQIFRWDNYAVDKLSPVKVK